MFTHQSLSFKAMLKNILFKCLFLSVVVISMFASNAYAKQETVRIELQYSEKLGEETKEGKPKCKKGGLVSEVDCVAERIEPSEGLDKSEKLASASLTLYLTPYLRMSSGAGQNVVHKVKIHVDGGGPAIVGKMPGNSIRDIQNDTKLVKERLREWFLYANDAQKQELSEKGKFAFTVERPFKGLKKLVLVNTDETFIIEYNELTKLDLEKFARTKAKYEEFEALRSQLEFGRDASFYIGAPSDCKKLTWDGYRERINTIDAFILSRPLEIQLIEIWKDTSRHDAARQAAKVSLDQSISAMKARKSQMDEMARQEELCDKARDVHHTYEKMRHCDPDLRREYSRTDVEGPFQPGKGWPAACDDPTKMFWLWLSDGGKSDFSPWKTD
jgi:hypothetical protein